MLSTENEVLYVKQQNVKRNTVLEYYIFCFMQQMINQFA